jgi:hypothetical protein
LLNHEKNKNMVQLTDQSMEMTGSKRELTLEFKIAPFLIREQ